MGDYVHYPFPVHPPPTAHQVRPESSPHRPCIACTHSRAPGQDSNVMQTLPKYAEVSGVETRMTVPNLTHSISISACGHRRGGADTSRDPTHAPRVRRRCGSNLDPHKQAPHTRAPQ